MAIMVYYSGHVQGVGFRATAAGLARRRGIKGWVRNLPDGRVQMFAEGPRKQIDEFMTELRIRMAEYIRSEEVHEVADEKHPEFRIIG